jgi:hypothetical protein
VFGDELVLNVFRKLEPGVNPWLEMLGFLTGRGLPNGSGGCYSSVSSDGCAPGTASSACLARQSLLTFSARSSSSSECSRISLAFDSISSIASSSVSRSCSVDVLIASFHGRDHATSRVAAKRYPLA